MLPDDPTKWPPVAWPTLPKAKPGPNRRNRNKLADFQKEYARFTANMEAAQVGSSIWRHWLSKLRDLRQAIDWWTPER